MKSPYIQQSKKSDYNLLVEVASRPQPIHGIGKLGEDSQQLKDLYELGKLRDPKTIRLIPAKKKKINWAFYFQAVLAAFVFIILLPCLAIFILNQLFI